MESYFAQNTTPNPCSLLSCHTSLLGKCMYTKHPQAHQKHPFSWPELEMGKMNYYLGNLDPNWAKCLKSVQNVSRSGQKKFIHAYGYDRLRWVGKTQADEEKALVSIFLHRGFVSGDHPNWLLAKGLPVPLSSL